VTSFKIARGILECAAEEPKGGAKEPQCRGEQKKKRQSG